MDKYTNFVLTVIAVALIGILFKGEKIISSAHAFPKHYHYHSEIQGLAYEVKSIVSRGCKVQITEHQINARVSCY